MSKKTRHADNSKRQQPVQQQRAQAAAQRQSTGKQPSAKSGSRNEAQDDAAEPSHKRKE